MGILGCLFGTGCVTSLYTVILEIRYHIKGSVLPVLLGNGWIGTLPMNRYKGNLSDSLSWWSYDVRRNVRFLLTEASLSSVICSNISAITRPTLLHVLSLLHHQSHCTITRLTWKSKIMQVLKCRKLLRPCACITENTASWLTSTSALDKRH